MAKKKVIILGAGIGGLSAAHTLAKRINEFDITVVEQNDYVGGQAAINIQDDTDNTSAICWHVITNQHQYLLNIMNEIHDDNGEKITNHLKIINKLIYCLQNRSHSKYNTSVISNKLKTFNIVFENIYNKKITKKDKYILYKIYIFANIISNERLTTYDTILWKDYICELSDDVKQWVLYYTSIYLNMDYNRVSTYFVFRLLRHKRKKININNEIKHNEFYTFDGTTSTILFTPWKIHLEKLGIKFLFNTTINHIYHTSPLTTISTINIKHNGCESTLTSDIFINALDSKTLATLYPLNNRFMELHDNSKYVQKKILFYLPYKVQNTGGIITALIFPKSQWFLCVRLVEDLWESEKYNYLMCSIGIWNKSGSNGKNATDCNRKELAAECWQQLIVTNHGLLLQSEMPRWGIWDNFQCSSEINDSNTIEPRFSNNINIQNIRPEYADTRLQNLYHATSYTKTNTNIYNMEAAAEAGTKAAQLICDKKDSLLLIKPTKYNIIFKEKNITVIVRACRTVDKYIFKITNYFK